MLTSSTGDWWPFLEIRFLKLIYKILFYLISLVVLRYLPFSAVHQAHVCRVVDAEDALEISLGSHPFGGLLTSSQEF